MILNYSNTHLKSLKNKLFPHRWAMIFSCTLAILLIIHSTSAYRGTISFPRAHWNNGNGFDDAANIVALHNFRHNGFIDSRGNENRKGMVLQDFFSIPCINENGTKALPTAVMDRYKDIDGFEIPLIAKNQNCYYHRTPPLHLWINYSLLMVTGFCQRTLPIANSLLMALWIYILYLFISQFSSRRSALFAVIFFASSMEFLGWSQASYNQPYQNLFFTLALYFFHRNMDEKNGGFWLVFFSACHALCTLELVPMQLTYMLLTLATNKSRPWRSVALGGGGIFLAFGLFALWYSAYAIDQMNIVELVTNGMTNRYLQTFSFSRWFENQWFETFKRLTETIYPSVLIPIFLSLIYFGMPLHNRLKKIVVVITLFLAAWSFNLLLPGHASYHVFILAKALIPFYLLLMALALDSAIEWLRKAKLILRYVAGIFVLVFIYRSAMGVCEYLNYYWHSTAELGTQNKARESIGSLVSFYPTGKDIVKINKNLKWEYYYVKNRLFDGLTPNRKGDEWRWAVSIDKALGIDFDWFYLHPITLKQIEVISSSQMQDGDCFLQAGNGSEPQTIKLERHSIETNYFWQKRIYRINAVNADWVRWRCRSKNNFYLYELRLL